MNDQLILKNRIKEARTERKLSQAALAELVGVSRNTISSIETGQFSPTAKLALILCIALDKKFEAFNWNVIKVCGHDFEALLDAFAQARACKGKPTMILLQTVKGKGVSFMEGNFGWHGKAPNDEQYEQAKAEVEAKLAELEGK